MILVWLASIMPGQDRKDKSGKERRSLGGQKTASLTRLPDHSTHPEGTTSQLSISGVTAAMQQTHAVLRFERAALFDKEKCLLRSIIHLMTTTGRCSPGIQPSLKSTTTIR